MTNPDEVPIEEIASWHLSPEETDRVIDDLEALLKVMRALKTQGMESVERAINLARLYRQDKVVQRALESVEAGQNVRAKIVADIRWLAEKRATYAEGAPPQIAEQINSEVSVAKLLAAIVEGTNDGWGWLPSLYWTDWEERNRGNSTTA